LRSVQTIDGVGAPVAASKPAIAEKPSMWSKERFSRISTKTFLTSAIANSPVIFPARQILRLTAATPKAISYVKLHPFFDPSYQS
jgi:hypothetical protein